MNSKFTVSKAIDTYVKKRPYKYLRVLYLRDLTYILSDFIIPA